MIALLSLILTEHAFYRMEFGSRLDAITAIGKTDQTVTA
jgi:hypothetical protein